MVHKKRHHFWTQFSIPFHMVWFVLCVSSKNYLMQPIRSLYSMVFEHMQQIGTHHVKGYGKLCQVSSLAYHCVWVYTITWAFGKMCHHISKPFRSFWFPALCYRESVNARYGYYSVVSTKSLFTPFHSPLSVIEVSITRLNIILAWQTACHIQKEMAQKAPCNKCNWILASTSYTSFSLRFPERMKSKVKGCFSPWNFETCCLSKTQKCICFSVLCLSFLGN